jgi:hypothetical protein
MMRERKAVYSIQTVLQQAILQPAIAVGPSSTIPLSLCLTSIGVCTFDKLALLWAVGATERISDHAAISCPAYVLSVYGRMVASTTSGRSGLYVLFCGATNIVDVN